MGRTEQYWGPAAQKGHLYENADVVAIAIMDVATNETFVGISGTASSNVPVSGTAVFNGDYSAVYYKSGTAQYAWNVTGAFATTVNF